MYLYIYILRVHTDVYIYIYTHTDDKMNVYNMFCIQNCFAVLFLPLNNWFLLMWSYICKIAHPGMAHFSKSTTNAGRTCSNFGNRICFAAANLAEQVCLISYCIFFVILSQEHKPVSAISVYFLCFCVKNSLLHQVFSVRNLLALQERPLQRQDAWGTIRSTCWLPSAFSWPIPGSRNMLGSPGIGSWRSKWSPDDYN